MTLKKLTGKQNSPLVMFLLSSLLMAKENITFNLLI